MASAGRSVPFVSTPRARELVDLAEAAAEPGAPDRERLEAKLRDSIDELVATLEQHLTSDPATALRLTAALGWLWQEIGRVDEGRRLTEQAIARSSGSPTPAFARSLLAAAELAFRQGDQAAAEQNSLRAIDAGEAAGDAGAVGLAYVHLARVAYRRGDAVLIEEHARRALEVGGADVGARRGGLHMLGWAAHTRGDLEGARRRFEESLAFREALGDRYGVAVESANLGDLAVDEGDLGEGARRLGDALVVARELRSTYLVLNLLPSLAIVAARAAEDEACARLVGATEALFEASGLIPDPGPWRTVAAEAVTRLGERFESLRAEGATLDEAAATNLGLRVAHSVADADPRPTYHAAERESNSR